MAITVVSQHENNQTFGITIFDADHCLLTRTGPETPLLRHRKNGLAMPLGSQTALTAGAYATLVNAMKSKKHVVHLSMRIAFYPFVLFTTLFSCTMSNQENKYTATTEELTQNNCYTDRKDAGALNDKEGEIFLIDNANFGIRLNGENHAPLLPCNLPERLQQTGAKIVFSGTVKETGLNEMWAGQPFVLTAVAEQ